MPVPFSGIMVRLVRIPTTIGNAGYLQEVEVFQSDEDGNFELFLEAGLEVDITIPGINFRRTVLVPDVDTALFSIP